MAQRVQPILGESGPGPYRSLEQSARCRQWSVAPVQHKKLQKKRSLTPQNKRIEVGVEGKGNETDWNLGPSATMLQCSHLDKFLLKQQNTKELYGTKNKCAHAGLGQILDKKIQRTKTQRPLLKSLASSDAGLSVVLPPSPTVTPELPSKVLRPRELRPEVSPTLSGKRSPPHSPRSAPRHTAYTTHSQPVAKQTEPQ